MPILDDATKKSLIPALRSGQYSLLLGAGFSATSTDANGLRLPLGGALAKEIAHAFGLPSDYSLASLASAVEPKALTAFLVSRFKGCKESDGIRLISQFVWRSIFTFNIDDALVGCYAGPQAQQKVSIITHADLFREPRELGELLAVHLHGSVRHPNDGFVFSPQEYGDAAQGQSVWFKIAVDKLRSSPLIVVGCALNNEPDLEFYLAQRAGVRGSSGTVAPSLYVTRDMDAVKKATCERFGFVPVIADADSFFTELRTEVGNDLPSPLQLLTPRTAESIFEKPPSEAAQRVFFRQWLLVDPENLPEDLETRISKALLVGLEPRWRHLTEAQDIVRDTTRELIAACEEGRNKGQLTFHLLTTIAGEGKSTVLMRAALELATNRVPVFWFTAQERLSSDVLEHRTG